MKAAIRDRSPLEIPPGQEGQAMRARAAAFVILGVTAMVGLPALGHAQSPAVTRGVLRGTLSSPDTTIGVVRAPCLQARRESCEGHSHLEARPG
jgi:hypothetical protein